MSRIVLAVAAGLIAATIVQTPTAGTARASLSQGTEDPPTAIATVTATLELATATASATATQAPAPSATATLKPWITPTLPASKRCKLVLGFLVYDAAGCVFLPRALKVHPTPTITPTPLPTSTPIPADTCRQLVQNPSFEDTPSLWRDMFPDRPGLTDVGITEATLNASPFDGRWMAQLWPDNDSEFAGIESRPGPLPRALTSATLRYSWFGHSLDRVANSDVMLVTLEDPGSAKVDLRLVRGYANEMTVNRWTTHEFDVTPIIKASTWTQVAVIFAGDNDFTDSTWWHIDLVTLTVCGSGWPAANDTGPVAGTYRAGDVSAQLDRLARDAGLK